MEIVTKVMEKSWKSHGNLLVKMCTNPVGDCIISDILMREINVETDKILYLTAIPVTVHGLCS